MNLETIEKIYSEVQAMQVELVKDVVMLDTPYLVKTLGICDDYLQKVDDYLGMVLRDIDRLKEIISDKKDIHAAQKHEILANDPEVKSLPTGAERANAAEFKLRDLKKEIKTLENTVTNLETLKDILIRKSKKIISSIISVKKQFDASLESAKYLNNSHRETTEETVYTSKDHSKTAVYEDPALANLIENDAPSHNKSNNGTSSLPIITEEEDSDEQSPEDLLSLL